MREHYRSQRVHMLYIVSNLLYFFRWQKIQSVPLVKSTHNCEQELVKSTGRLVSAMCEEKHVFAPFSRQESGAVTHSKQTLTFRNEGRARTDLGKFKESLSSPTKDT